MASFRGTLVLIGICLLLAGCVRQFSDEQYIIVEQYTEGSYKKTKEIRDQKKVKKISNLVKDIHWIDRTFGMKRRADYQFYFQFTDPNIEAKVVGYDLWVHSDKSVELTTGHRYAALDKTESKEVIKIITEKN